jgi:hypothetical protein
MSQCLMSVRVPYVCMYATKAHADAFSPNSLYPSRPLALAPAVHLTHISRTRARIHPTPHLPPPTPSSHADKFKKGIRHLVSVAGRLADAALKSAARCA